VSGRVVGNVIAPDDIDRLWAALADPDARAAYQAIARLATVPERAVELVGRHVKPVQNPDRKTVDQLITDLDNESFRVREAVSEGLSRLGVAVTPQLRSTLAAITGHP
jgi:hypothetical protein